jgi:hypothetical protein
MVLIKLFHASHGLSEASWEGPYPVLLSTPTGVMVTRLDSCIHISQAKHWTLEPDEPEEESSLETGS